MKPLAIILFLSMLALPASGQTGQSSQSAANANANSASAFFNFAATDTNDKNADLAHLRGKPLVVNFWARWCAPCRKELPDLVEMDARYRARGIIIVGVAIEEPRMRDKVREFAKSYGVDYRIVLAGTSPGVELMNALGNDKSALPFTVVIDRSGKVQARKLGAMTKAEMEAEILSALK